MDRAKIGARAQTKQRGKEMRGFLSQFLCTQNVGTLTTRSRSEGKGGKGEEGGGSVFTSRSFILTEVVSVTRPDAGA